MDEQMFNALRKEVRDFKIETEDRLSIVEARLDRIDEALAGGAQVMNIANVTVAAPVEPAAVTEPDHQPVADDGGATDPAGHAGDEPAAAAASVAPASEEPASDDALATADLLKTEAKSEEPAKPEELQVLPLKGSKAKS